jgi:diacylglycerol kinase
MNAMLRLPTEPKPRPRRPWSDKFGDAFRGLKHGIRSESTFAVHFFMATLVVMSATILRCSCLDWCLLLLAIGGVLTAELFNTSLEMLFRGLDEATKERSWRCLDVGAAAVLLASITAALVGIIVFAHRFYRNMTLEP